MAAKKQYFGFFALASAWALVCLFAPVSLAQNQAGLSLSEHLYFGELLPNGTVLLSDGTLNHSEKGIPHKKLRVVPMFKNELSWEITATKHRRPPANTALFVRCDLEEPFRIQAFKGPKKKLSKKPIPVVAWDPREGITYYRVKDNRIRQSGWVKTAREIAGKSNLKPSMLAVSVPLTPNGGDGVFVQLRNYKNPTSECNFPYEEWSIVLDHQAKFLGKSRKDFCFPGKPFIWNSRPGDCKKLRKKKRKKLCRWPPDSHYGPYRNLARFFGPGKVVFGLDMNQKFFWLRMAESLETTIIWAEYVEDLKIVQDLAASFYHCAY